jgi:hypothetical protein
MASVQGWQLKNLVSTFAGPLALPELTVQAYCCWCLAEFSAICDRAGPFFSEEERGAAASAGQGFLKSYMSLVSLNLRKRRANYKVRPKLLQLVGGPLFLSMRLRSALTGSGFIRVLTGFGFIRVHAGFAVWSLGLSWQGCLRSALTGFGFI